MNVILGALAAYLLGSIPTSYIFGKVFKKIDIRKYGSGNVGATNVFRVMGKKYGIAVLIIDMLKGFLAVAILPILFYSEPFPISLDLLKIILGVASICGHIWTVFLKFKGGKGVATSAGVLIGLSPIVMLCSLVVWSIVAFLSKYVSLASIIAALSVPIFMWLLKQPKQYLIVTSLLAVLVVYKHRSNIGRLLSGQEAKIGQKVHIPK